MKHFKSLIKIKSFCFCLLLLVNPMAAASSSSLSPLFARPLLTEPSSCARGDSQVISSDLCSPTLIDLVNIETEQAFLGVDGYAKKCYSADFWGNFSSLRGGALVRHFQSHLPAALAEPGYSSFSSLAQDRLSLCLNENHRLENPLIAAKYFYYQEKLGHGIDLLQQEEEEIARVLKEAKPPCSSLQLTDLPYRNCLQRESCQENQGGKNSSGEIAKASPHLHEMAEDLKKDLPSYHKAQTKINQLNSKRGGCRNTCAQTLKEVESFKIALELKHPWLLDEEFMGAVASQSSKSQGASGDILAQSLKKHFDKKKKVLAEKKDKLRMHMACLSVVTKTSCKTEELIKDAAWIPNPQEIYSILQTSDLPRQEQRNLNHLYNQQACVEGALLDQAQLRSTFNELAQDGALTIALTAVSFGSGVIVRGAMEGKSLARAGKVAIVGGVAGEATLDTLPQLARAYSACQKASPSQLSRQTQLQYRGEEAGGICSQQGKTRIGLDYQTGSCLTESLLTGSSALLTTLGLTEIKHLSQSQKIESTQRAAQKSKEAVTTAATTASPQPPPALSQSQKTQAGSPKSDEAKKLESEKQNSPGSSQSAPAESASTAQTSENPSLTKTEQDRDKSASEDSLNETRPSEANRPSELGGTTDTSNVQPEGSEPSELGGGSSDAPSGRMRGPVAEPEDGTPNFIDRRTEGDSAKNLTSEDRLRFRKKYLKIDRRFASTADNIRYIRAADTRMDRNKGRFVVFENSKLKDLNDGLQDKDLITAVTNKYKELLFEEIKEVTRLYPELEVAPYNDYKSLQLLFSSKGDLPADLDKELSRAFGQAQNKFETWVVTEMQFRSSDFNNVEIKSVFRMGLGQTADEAALAARFARGKSEFEESGPHFERSQITEHFQKTLNQTQELHKELSKALSNTPFVETPRGGLKPQINTDTFEVLRKYNTGSDPAEVATALQDRFDFTKPLPEEIVQKLLIYKESIDQFSPSLRVPERTNASLDKAPYGGFTIDFVGMGARNLAETQVRLLEKPDLDTAIRSVRDGERLVTREFDSKKESVKTTIQETFINSQNGNAKIETKCSGDDCVGHAKAPLSIEEKRRLVSRFMAQKDRSSLRIAFVSPGPKLRTQEEASVLGTHGEDIEKRMMKILSRQVNYKKIKKVTFAIDMRAHYLGSGPVSFIAGVPEDVSLTQRDRLRINEAFKKAVQELNEVVEKAYPKKRDVMKEIKGEKTVEEEKFPWGYTPLGGVF